MFYVEMCEEREEEEEETEEEEIQNRKTKRHWKFFPVGHLPNKVAAVAAVYLPALLHAVTLNSPRSTFLFNQCLSFTITILSSAPF